MAKDLTYDNDASKKILAGSNKLAKTVAVTMGPQGKNVIIGKFVGAPVLTKDGVSVAREIVLEDPVEDLACQLIKEASGRTASVAGDGTTTATVLADEILKNGLDLLQSGYPPLLLKRGVELARKLITDNLNNLRIEVSSSEDLENIATISCNNDSELGKSIAEAFSLVDMQGTVVAQAHPGIGNNVSLVNGISLESGWVSPAFAVDNPSEVILDNCRILISDEEISNISFYLKVLNSLSDTNQPLLIVAKDVNREALQTLVANNKLGRLKVVAVKMPIFGAAQEEWVSALASMVGTSVIGTAFSVTDLSVDSLGFAKRVVVNRVGTKIIESRRNEDELAEKLETYKTDLSKLLSESALIDTRNRIAFINGKASVISVGYSTELELREKGDRVEDAICATKAAIEEGYVPGGGTALLKCSRAIDLSKVDSDLAPAVKVVLEACSRPLRQICENAGKDSDKVIDMVLSNRSFNYGYNAATDSYEDLVNSGIVDPKKVTRTALENAVSISMLLINTGAVVSEQQNNPSSWQPPAGWRPPEEGKLSHKY
jgi:chaperonin GroEL